MTDHRRVYTKMKKMLKQMLEMDHQGQVVTLAMMISGIVMSRSAQLSAMRSEIPTDTKEKSIEMRLRCWVKGDIDVEAVYLPFAHKILKTLSHIPLVLVMDKRQAGRGCMVLMVGVLFQKRALPTAWLVYKGKKRHASAEWHIQALEKVLALVSSGSEVVLLGDNEYDTTEIISWVEKNTIWPYVLCTSPQIYMQAGQKNQPLLDYPLEKGKLFHLPETGFTKTTEVVLGVIGRWGSRYKEQIFLVTNMPTPYQACCYYRQCSRIETFFSNQKGRGFHIHKSHLADPARLNSFLIATFLTYIWMICQELQVIATNSTSLIDRTKRIGKSLFHLGLDWIKYALKHRFDFHPIFHFQPLEILFHVQ